MRIICLAVFFAVSGLCSFSQDISTYRNINVSLSASEPEQLQINHGRLIWNERDPDSATYSLKYYSGAEIFTLDSNRAGFTHSIDGNYIAWNTPEEEIKVFNTRDWSTVTVSASYNPDHQQPVGGDQEILVALDEGAERCAG